MKTKKTGNKDTRKSRYQKPRQTEISLGAETNLLALSGIEVSDKEVNSEEEGL